MRGFVSRALGSLDPRGGPAVLTLPAPAFPPERALSLPGEGPALAWLDPEGWSLVGRGDFARVTAEGPERFARVRDEGRALLVAVQHRPAPGLEGVPLPRLFGGFAFSPGAALEAPWRGFGDADFILPRWAYGRRGDRAFVQLALDPAASPGVDGVLERWSRWLAWGTAPREREAPSGGARVTLTESSPEAWSALVEGALSALRGGRFQKVVLARRSHLVAAGALDVGAALTALSERYPGCVRFALERGGGVFLGATPERLVTLRAGALLADALAGSLPHEGEGFDAAEALLESDKDQREHAAVVSGIVGSLRALGASVAPHGPPRVKPLRGLLHLWTPVEATLGEGAHVLDAVASLHPTPAVCGLPRETSGAWLSSSEPCPRGWYASPVGWFDATGEGSFSVAIRSALVRGREAWLWSGAGIVEGSDPRREWAETAAKQRAVLSALGGVP